MYKKFATVSEHVSDNTEEIDTLSATETDEKVCEENEKVITWLELTINGYSYKCY